MSQNGGMKYFGCFVGDSCQKIGDDHVFEPLSLYRYLGAVNLDNNFNRFLAKQPQKKSSAI